MGQNCVTLLGVKGGPAIRPESSMPTSILVEMAGKTILVDAGLGCSTGLVRAGVALTDLDAIFITHLHSDHYLELGPLLHTAWTAGLDRTIPIYGPTGLPVYWACFLAAMEFDISLRIMDEGRPDLSGLVEFTTLQAGENVTLDGIEVSVMKNVHPPIAESYALRFDAAGRSATLSGDTVAMEEMIEFARGSDILVHEAMLEAGIDALCARVGNTDDRLRTHLMRSHTPAAEAGRIATEAGVAQLALNHLVPNDDPDFSEEDWRAEVAPAWFGPLFIGRDGMRIDLAD
ncbi:MAG: MBL fold metallo-hydrolase [Litoreibacter sp.]|nr:MBL fold metallo-hydrolase [Litoreibacter sp.]